MISLFIQEGLVTAMGLACLTGLPTLNKNTTRLSIHT